MEVELLDFLFENIFCEFWESYGNGFAEVHFLFSDEFADDIENGFIGFSAVRADDCFHGLNFLAYFLDVMIEIL